MKRKKKMTARSLKIKEVEARLTDFLKRRIHAGFFEFWPLMEKIAFNYIEGNRLKGIESVDLSGLATIDADDGFLQIRSDVEDSPFVRFTPESLLDFHEICTEVVKIASEYDPVALLNEKDLYLLEDFKRDPEETLGHPTEAKADYILDDVVLIVRTCPKCGKKFHFAVMRDDYEFRREGGAIEHAFHYLTEEEQALYAGCPCRECKKPSEDEKELEKSLIDAAGMFLQTNVMATCGLGERTAGVDIRRMNGAVCGVTLQRDGGREIYVDEGGNLVFDIDTGVYNSASVAFLAEEDRKALDNFCTEVKAICGKLRCQ